MQNGDRAISIELVALALIKFEIYIDQVESPPVI